MASTRKTLPNNLWILVAIITVLTVVALPELLPNFKLLSWFRLVFSVGVIVGGAFVLLRTRRKK
jgi:uncharacterized membrane protein